MFDIGLVDSNIKKVSIPQDNFVMINGVKPAKVSNNVVEGMRKFYNQDKKIDYREKITEFTSLIGDIYPVENQLNNVLYMRNYLEKGISVKCSVNDIKQAWIEYRLLHNEKKYNQEIKRNGEKMEDKESYVLSNFDEIFDNLSKQIDSTDEYINKLSDFKNSMDNSTTILDNNKKTFDLYMQKEREAFEKEKKLFEEEKKAFEMKMKMEKEKMDKNYQRLQELTNKFNKQVTRVIED